MEDLSKLSDDSEHFSSSIILDFEILEWTLDADRGSLGGMNVFKRLFPPSI